MNGRLSTSSENYNDVNLQDSGYPMYVVVGTDSLWDLSATCTS